MNPQDGRSILQQQRWIEVYNAGGSEIPAYGVMECTDNTDDDTEFRSYVSVQRPTRDGCPHVLVNSMVPIGPGKTGWATRDYPVYALCESVGVGRMVGTEKDSYTLKKDVPGFTIMGGGPAGTKRVMFHYVQCIEAELGSELCATDPTATIGGAEDCESLEISSALNIYALAGPSGYAVELVWLNAEQDWVVAQVKHRVWVAVTDIIGDPDNCAIKQRRYKQMTGMWCGSTTDEVAIQMFSLDVVVDLNSENLSSGISETCRLTQTKKTICTLNDLSEQAGNTTTAMMFNMIEVLVDVSLNSDRNVIEGTTWYVFVPCDDPGRTTVDLIDLTPCDTSSS